ncbi:kinase-like protein [Xylariaceae sp. AK1471]|nr:kinase-like protein [Xylariaceae sp. AK1471]
MGSSSRSSSRHSSQPSSSSSSLSVKSSGQYSQSSNSSSDDLIGHGLYSRLWPMVIGRGHTNRGLHFQFLPLDAIEKTITAETVDAQSVRYRLFKAHSSSSEQVVEQARGVFAIVGLCDKDKSIRNLFREGLTDQHLPLEKRPVKGNPNTLISHQGKEFKSLSNWDTAAVDYFLERQWLVLAPVFRMRGEHIDVNERAPLPVYKIEEISSGNARTVYSARLRAAHLMMHKAKKDPRIAVKCYTLEDDFKNEKQNLLKLQDLNHPHLIRHLATVQHGDLYYAILYWADGGSLSHFWKRYPDAFSTRRPELFMWCFQQMFGLVDALVALHRAGYRHGDLKPENILHFQNSDDPDIRDSTYGTLVITDVGISKYHQQATELRRDGTDTKATTPCYEAPEAELDQKNSDQRKPRSRRYDMWSVGCIYMEFTVWLLYGHKAIVDFKERRRLNDEKAAYYELTAERTAKINEAVSTGLDALRKDPRCAKDTGLADLVSLISNQLIVIDPGQRANAEELRDEFKKILQKARGGLLTKSVEPPPSVPGAFRPR